MPTQLNETLDAYYSKVAVYIESLDLVQNAVSDIILTYPLIIGSAGIALVISFVWMVVMKCCAACITWSLIMII